MTRILRFVTFTLVLGPLFACEQPPTQRHAAPPATAPFASACLGETHLEVAYAADKRTRLDVFLPKAPRQRPVPWVLWVHGGGWAGGSKTSVETFALRQTCRGYAVVAVDYRLSFEARHPAALADLRAALRFVRANASDYQLDPDSVVLWGASAGGHLASLLALTQDQKHLDRRDDPHRKIPLSVRGVIAWWAPSSFSRFDEDFGETCPTRTCHTCEGSSESRYLGCGVKTCPERARRASPVTWVHAKAPPFLLQHGSDDCTVPAAQSQRFAEALAAAGAPVQLEILPGGRHGDGTWLGSQVRASVDGFLDRHLQTSAISGIRGSNTPAGATLPPTKKPRASIVVR